MKKVSKAQAGVKKKAVDSVPSEMFPGKMIPKSAVRKGPYITTSKKAAPKKKMGGKVVKSKKSK
jgi:hypothetical protein